MQPCHSAIGSAAEDDGGRPRSETGGVDAENVRVVTVGMKHKAPPYRRDRRLPADREVIAANGDFDAGAEQHPLLRIEEHARAEGVPAAQLMPDLRMFGDV